MKYAQIALPFILLVSGIIVEIVIAGVLMAYFLNTSAVNERLSLKAYAAAYSGLQDAMWKISRDKDFTISSCDSLPPDPLPNYEITVEGGDVSMYICRTDVMLDSYTYEVTAIVDITPFKKRLLAILIVNKITGEVNLKSIINVPSI